MHFEVVGGDRRLREIKAWEPWFREVSKSRKAFSKALNFDPMINETASMGVLASAASKAGMLALTEYVCRKRAAHDGRAFRNGRADLWVYDPSTERSWAFEAKQIHCTPGMRYPTLRAALDAARKDAADIPHWEADRRFGMLVMTLPPGLLTEATHCAIDTLVDNSFATFRVDGGALSTVIVIDRARRPRKSAPRSLDTVTAAVEGETRNV